MKPIAITCLLLFFLVAPVITSTVSHAAASAQSNGDDAMIDGVMAHRMTAAQAQLLSNSNINWVSCDVTFNSSDVSQWGQVYSLAKRYNLHLMGILDQHLMDYNDSFTLADWSNAVIQAVQTYGTVVKTWEIWNEPSLPDSVLGYFNGSAQTYVIMLQTAYDDIKTLAPADAVIGLGGLPLYTADNPTLSDPYSQKALAWATQVVQLGGMNYCDAIAVHAYPYGQYYPQIAGTLFSYNLQQYGQLCSKPIWVTEVGQESYSTNWTATDDQQSTFLQESYQLFQGLDVKAYFWYELNDNYTSIPDSNFGLFDNDGNPKPAFNTYVDMVNGVSSPTATSTTSTPSPQQNPTATSSPATSTFSPTASQTPAVATATPKAQTTQTPKANFAWNDTAIATTVAIGISAAALSIFLRKRQPRQRVAKNFVAAASLIFP